jgi:TolB-like protein/Tfp pilus assembly protein PilF
LRLLAELKRRNVIRVSLFYIVSSWLLLQIADLVFELLLVPDWTLRFIFGLLLAAFPFVLFLAWAYEMTPDGIRRQADIDRSQSITHETGRKLNIAVLVVAALAIALMLWDRVAPTPGHTAGQMASAAPSVQTEPGAEASEPSSSKEPSAAASADTGVSIAVLPFANMSGNADNEYFSDGLTDTLLHVLSNVPELRVAARTSSFKFKGKAEDVSVIGNQLRVDNVLEGSVQRSGNRVRITAQLIKTEDGFHLWSGTFDRTLDDIFAVQDEIATNVVGALTDTLLGDLPKAEAIDVEVFDDFLRAQAKVFSRDADQVESAVALLESVVDRSPEFARGYALLSEAYREKVRATETLWEDVQPLALAAAERAVKLDPKKADAWLAMAGVRRWQEDFTDMLEMLKKAVELEPNNARAQAEYGSGLRRMNRLVEALPYTRRAVLLDPLNPQLKEGLASAYLFANRYTDAQEMLESALQQTPDEPILLSSLAGLHEVLGRWAEALTVSERLRTVNPRDFNNLRRIFDLYRGAGDLDTAQAILDRLLESSEARALDEAAEFCLQRGDRQCWQRYTKQYVESRDSEPDDLARIAYVSGDFDQAIALLKQDIENEERLGESRSPNRVELASLLHRRGEFDERDALLAEALERLSETLDQGLEWGYVTRYLPALHAAARGDAGQAYELASIVNREGPPIANFLIDNFLIWDTIRDTPEFQKLQSEVRARQAEVLAAMRAVATWDPRSE